MAWSAISVNGITPWFQGLCADGSVSTCAFAFYASKNADNSSITIGGANEAYYTGSMTYHKLKSESYWPTNL